jgi:hypothetical protein
MLNGAGARYLAGEEVEKIITVEAGVAGEFTQIQDSPGPVRLTRARVNRSRLGEIHWGATAIGPRAAAPPG